MLGLLIAVASLVAKHRLQGAWASAVVAYRFSSGGLQALECRLRSCGTWASLLRSMWSLPRPRIKPTSPAQAGGSHPLRHQGSPRRNSLYPYFYSEETKRERTRECLNSLAQELLNKELQHQNLNSIPDS